MDSTVPSKKSAPNSRTGPLDRVFTAFETLAYYHPWWVLFVSLSLAALSLWYTATHLQFNTSREDLISKDMRFHVLYQQYRERFQDFDGMIVVVEGEEPVTMKRFADRLAEKLKDRPEISSGIYYKINTDYFKSKSLLFLEPQDLNQLQENLQAHQEFLKRVNASPGLNTLLASLNREISTGMVDSMLGDFLGTEEETEVDDETEDLGLLISLLTQMNRHVEGGAVYRSPWGTLLEQENHPLREAGYLVSDDERLLFILLNPEETEGDFAGSKDAIEGIRAVIAELLPGFPQIKVGMTGGEVISSDEMFTTHTDVKRASWYALTGVALLFILFYRRVTEPLLAVFTLIVSIAWAMGYTTLAVGHLNILSVVFTTILIGLGIDFGIHILCRYREERRLGHGTCLAMRNTLQLTGRGNLAGAVTTAIAFGAMVFTDFIGIVELGIIAAGGIVLCLLGMLLLLPALISLEERWRQPVYLKPERVEKRDALFEKLYSHYYLIIFASLALLAWCGYVSKDLYFDYNLLNMQAKGTEAVQYELKIIENAKRASWNAALVADNLEDAREKYRILKAMPSVGNVESLLTALPENQETRIQNVNALAPLIDPLKVQSEDEPFSLSAVRATLEKIRFKLRKKEKEGEQDDVYEASNQARLLEETLQKADPDTAAQRLKDFSKILFADYRGKITDLQGSVHPTPVKVEDIPGDLKDRFVSADGKYLLLVYPSINIWEREEMEKFLYEMKRIDPNVTGNAVHMFESSRLMIDGYIRAGLYALAAITLYLLLTLRNVLTTLLVLLPTLAGAVFTLGLMHLTGIQFNLANLVILPLILGIGVVDGVHILHRNREEPECGRNVISKSTGQAVVLTSLTTMIGFGSLMVADHQGVYSVGLVLTLGVGSCMITSITLLPALIKLCCARGWRI
ncbi:MAG: MMPL family transporter [Nitrospinota bacterium]|nr:MMPL family transporter [Nitrospinota bacterium]